jgi:hypothetical protein
MPARHRQRRALMGVSARAESRMIRVLSGWDLARATSVHEFVHELRCSTFDLVIVGTHFDGSRALEAVKAARFQAPQVPLACICAVPFQGLGEASLAAFRAAAEEMGADCFIDVLQFPDDAEGNARVRTLLERLTSSPSP